MIEFIHFLLKPNSIITLLLPSIFSLYFIVSEIKNPQTDKRYFFYFAATLFLGYFANRWEINAIDTKEVVRYHIALHIWPLFLIFVSLLPFLNIKWEISTKMFMTLSYLQVLFVDCVIVYTTNIQDLFIQKMDMNEKDAKLITDSMGAWYSGIGGAGPRDILFLAFIMPFLAIVLDKAIKALKNNYAD